MTMNQEMSNTGPVSWLETLLQDLRFGARQLARNPGFAVVAILMLGIGIGANLAVFSFVNSVLLRPLHYPHSDRLTTILSDLGDSTRAPASSFDLYQIRQRSRTFEQIAGIWVTNRVLPGRGDLEQGKMGLVTSNFLQLFCVRPALGRFFGPEDDRDGAPPALILSHELWVRKFDSDPEIIGKLVKLGGESSTVVGVLPPNFRLIFAEDASVPPHVDYFQPVPIGPWEPNGPAFLHLVGRLRADSQLTSAQAELATIAEQINNIGDRTRISNYHLYAYLLQDDDIREIRRTLNLFFGAAGFILLIGCANVANLLMVRARQRLREITIRAALGASAPRLIRQIATETLLVVLLGYVIGLPLGWVALHGILALEPASFAHLAPVTLDLRALAFAFGVAILISIPVAMAPISLVRHVDIAEDLKRSGKSTTHRKRTFAAMLVATEVALAFVLLIGTGLLVSTFTHILKVDPGFRAENVFTLRVNVPGYEVLRQVQRSLAALPGVQSVSAVSHLPLQDTGNWYDYYWKDGATLEQQNTALTDMRSILPGFFNSIGAQWVQGRDFTESDDVAHQHVAIIDETLARRLWPGEVPLGKRINISDSPKGFYQFQRDWVVIVGVVRNVRYHGLASTLHPQVYLPFSLAPRPSMSLVLHTSGNLTGFSSVVRKQIASLNLNVPITQVEPLSLVVDQARADSRFVSVLATLLSLIGIQLAIGGIYGVLSYSVVLRTTEIGIRMAVGAQRGEIMRLIFLEGFASVALGIAGGSILSAAFAPLLDHLLFEVKPGNPAVYLGVTALILLLSGAAMLVPVMRAMKTDPWAAITCD